MVRAEAATKFSTADRAHGDVIAVTPEVDLVAGLDAQLVTELLGDHNLPLRSDPVSHTKQYNYRVSIDGGDSTRMY